MQASAHVEVKSETASYGGNDSNGQDQEEEVLGLIGTGWAVVIGPVAGAVLGVMLESTAALALGVSMLTAATHGAPSLVFLSNQSVDTGYQWSGRQRLIVQ